MKVLRFRGDYLLTLPLGTLAVTGSNGSKPRNSRSLFHASCPSFCKLNPVSVSTCWAFLGGDGFWPASCLIVPSRFCRGVGRHPDSRVMNEFGTMREIRDLKCRVRCYISKLRHSFRLCARERVCVGAGVSLPPRPFSNAKVNSGFRRSCFSPRRRLPKQVVQVTMPTELPAIAS